MEDDPQLKVLDKLEARFGNDESLVIAIENEKGIFNKKTISSIREITEKMWETSQVLRVDSITNYNVTDVHGDDIETKSLIGEDLDSQDYNQIKKKALSHRVLPGYLVSADATTALVYVRITPSFVSTPDYNKLVLDTREKLKGLNNSEIKTYISGQVAVTQNFQETVASDMQRILPLLFIAIVFILFVLFRDFKSILFPLLITTFSISSSLGLMFYLGIDFNSVLSILPGIITAICIADSVHILSCYRQFRQKNEHSKALYMSLKKNFIPTLLTSVSTGVGFISLCTASLVPIAQLGLIASFGCLYAWVLSYFFFAPLLLLFQPKFKALKEAKTESNSKFSEYLSRVIENHKWKIIVVFSVLVAFSIHKTTKVNINANPYDYFKSDTVFYKTNTFIKKKFGGSAGPEIMINAPEVDGVKDPLFLKKVEAYKDWLGQLPQVTKTIDLLDIIKEMNQALNEGQENFYRLADSKNAIAEQIFLYQMSLPQGLDLNNKVSLDFSSLRMSVIWNVDDTKTSLAIVDKMEAKAKELGLDVQITGKVLLLQKMSSYIISTLLSSIVVAFFIVSLLLMITFKSFYIGLISIIPNVIPLTFGGLFMALADINLNFGTALVFSVCLGIAVDDTIHFLSSYNKHKKENKLNTRGIVEQIISDTGLPLILTTVILVIAFGLFVIGDFIPNVQFGILCALILSSALIVDFVFLPSLLMLRKNDK
ncbi:MMPL family transporter [bacterium]|nr:MMPL family transporter [bacterium]